MESIHGGTLSPATVSLVSTPFTLDKAFVQGYAKRRPPFGLVSGPNTVGEITFMRTYARRKPDGTLERWYEVCERVVNGTYRLQQHHIEQNRLGWDPDHAQRSAQEMYDRMWSMKFLPPGRGLWIMGTEFIEQRKMYAALQNCLDGNTEIITDKGVVTLASVQDQVVRVLTHKGYKAARVKCFGVQPVQRVVLRPHDGVRSLRSNLRQTVVATPNHRWILKGGAVSTSLIVGDILTHGAPVTTPQSEQYQEGFRHGLVFGDGCMQFAGKEHFSHSLRLCGAKAQHANCFDNILYPASYAGDPVAYINAAVNLKQLPDENADADYLFGFIRGWMATDGGATPAGSCRLSTQDKTAADWLVRHASFAGLVVTGSNVDSVMQTNFGERSAPCIRITLAEAASRHWIVESITPLDEEVPVFCPTVPDEAAFTLAGGVYTGNCAFVSTENIDVEGSEPFTWLMDASMLGVGVGFDNAGAGKLLIHSPMVPTAKPVSIDSSIVDGQVYPIYNQDDNPEYQVVTITDDREGWVNSMRQLLDSYFIPNRKPVLFNYHHIRRSGLPIKGFGGTSSGPWALWNLHRQAASVLSSGTGKSITVRIITDLMNMIGACVVAGNVRRSAEISFGEWDSDEFINLKNTSDGIASEHLSAYNERLRQLRKQKNYTPTIDCFDDLDIPEDQLARALDKVHRLNSHGWCSNNTIFARRGMNYGPIAERIRVNGEPGIAWLDNMRKYGRMCDPPDNKDYRVKGGNPCFSGDTMIAVADGRHAVSIKQLAEEGLDVPVYAVDKQGKLCIKTGRAPRITGRNRQLYKLTLDDGSTVRATGNHEFMLSDGDLRPLDQLKPGDSLLVRSKFKYGNRRKTTGDWCGLYYGLTGWGGVAGMMPEHRAIAGHFHGALTSDQVPHHKDYDGCNNRPDNLEVMTTLAHRELHRQDKLGLNNPYYRLPRDAQLRFTNYDRRGDKNPMSGQRHSHRSRTLIGKRTRDRCKDPAFRRSLAAAIRTSMQADNVRELLSAAMIRRYKACPVVVLTPDEVNAVLKRGDPRWNISGVRYFVEKKCPVTAETFIVPIGQRGQMAKDRKAAAVLQGQRSSATKVGMAGERFDLIARHVVKHVQEHQMTLDKFELVALAERLTGKGLRLTAPDGQWVNGSSDFYSAMLRLAGAEDVTVDSFALRHVAYRKELADRLLACELVFNHKVVSVELDAVEDVYCMGVDDVFNLCVITPTQPSKHSGLPKWNLVVAANCLEQSLEDRECCTLVETFIHRHTDLADYLRTLKFAYLYAKTVTLGATHWPKTNKVMARNRRIGCSMTGVAQFVETRSLSDLTTWCNAGYAELEKWDVVYSEWMGIPMSRKKTSVKPSGTVSKVVGASPGAHFPIEVYSIIRIRFANDDPLLAELRSCGYFVEPAVGQEKTTSVVEIPSYLGDDIRTEGEVSIWEQVNLACHLQSYWADNQVSFTGKFDPETEGHMLGNILSMCETRLKGISFLPKDNEAYPQMPNEAITKEEYYNRIRSLKPVNFDRLYDSGKLSDGVGERFCSTDKCELNLTVS